MFFTPHKWETVAAKDVARAGGMAAALGGPAGHDTWILMFCDRHDHYASYMVNGPFEEQITDALIRKAHLSVEETL